MITNNIIENPVDLVSYDEFIEVSSSMVKKTDSILQIDDFRKLNSEMDDTERIKRAMLQLKTNGGGTLLFGCGEYIISSTITVSSSIKIQGCGPNTIFKLSNLSDAIYIFSVGGNNVSFSRFTIDGNKSNQRTQIYQSGIFSWKVDNMNVDNIIIKDVTGEGLFIGYCDAISENITINNCKIMNCGRNEVCVGNGKNVLFTNTDIKSYDATSATIDIEKHSSTDIHQNITFRNCTIKTGAQAIKYLSNNFIQDTHRSDIVIFDNCVIDGFVAATCVYNLHLINGTHFGYIELHNCNGVILNSCVVNGDRYVTLPRTGLYAYNEPGYKVNSENLVIRNCEFSNTNRGIQLQGCVNSYVEGCRIINNKCSGITFFYENTNILLSGNVITDTREESDHKTQIYAIKFVSNTQRYIKIINNLLLGNKLSVFDNMTERNVILLSNDYNYNIFELVDGETKSKITYESLTETLVTASCIQTPLLKMRNAIASTDWRIKNGTIFEDISDGKLKYKNHQGVIQILSN